MATDYSNTQHVDLANAREDEQRQVMKKIIEANECPFCLENLQKYHTPPILFETAHWLLTSNRWPYKHTQYHLLAILKSHKEMLAELTTAEGAELVEILHFAQEHTQALGGGVAMRFGDTSYSAGTIKHLHVQFIVPDIDQPDFEPVRIKIGKSVNQLKNKSRNK